MAWGFYQELAELQASGLGADFGFLENVPVGEAYWLYDFLHGHCDQFAAALSDFFGYEIEYVLGDDGNLIHAYCVRELANGDTAYIDARGVTTDVELFFDEFADWCTYDARHGELCDLEGPCQVFRHKDTKEMYSDEDREMNQDKELYQFLKDNCSYYNVNAFERSLKNMIENGVEYRVEGYTNKWALIDTLEQYGLLENSTYGDETCYLLVDLTQEPEMRRYKRTDGSFVELPTIMEVLGETFDGLEIGLEDLGIELPERVIEMVEDKDSTADEIVPGLDTEKLAGVDLVQLAFSAYEYASESEDWVERHKEALVYGYQHFVRQIDMDFWVQYEELLGEKMSYEEYLYVDNLFDGDPLEYLDAELTDAEKEEFAGLRDKLLQMREGKDVSFLILDANSRCEGQQAGVQTQEKLFE